MKKFIIIILFLNSQFFILNSLRAQGFEWVRTYTGSDISSGDATNKIIGSCVDSAGNLYILGQFSPYAQLCGERLLPSDVIEPSSPRWQGIVIAKLSPAGELLWHKAIYNGKRGCYAHALRMVGDSCIMAMVRFYLPFDNGYSGGYNVSMKLYYLDTLLTGNDDYLMPSDSVIITEDFTAFITFDLDGNEVERHLVGVGYTDTIGNALTHRFRMGGGTAYSDKLSVDALSHESFNIDNEGNIYVLRNTQDEVSGASYHYWRVADGTIGSMKIVVDGTHFITYTIPYPTAVWNQQILKFSPHFDSLIDAVYMFDIPLNNHTRPTLEVQSFDIDKQNNLFINMTGITIPAGLRLSNSNSLDLGDATSGLCWTLRYNPNLMATGLIKMSYFGNCPDDPQINLTHNCVDDTNSVFVSGYADWSILNTVDGIIYQNDTLDIPNKSGFWLRLNKEDLSLLSYGILAPGDDGSVAGLLLAVKNNRILSQLSFLWSISFADSVIYANHYSDYEKAFAIWDYYGNGLLFKKYGVGSIKNLINSPIVIDSIVYLTGSFFNDATFGDTTIHYQGYSQAFIAKYVDPEFARPYMHPSDREEQAIEWPQTLAFTLADSPVTLTATATSGLPVSYSCSDSTVAYLEGDQLHLLREGSATVTAMQPGDYYHMPAEPVTKTLQVGHVGIAASENHAPLLYPNPATNAVRIIPNGERVTAVRLVSALGQPLPAPLSAGRIDLSALPAGIYYLSIITETTSYQHKIVKQ